MAYEHILTYIKNDIKNHKKTFDSNSITNFLDIYFKNVNDDANDILFKS